VKSEFLTLSRESFEDLIVNYEEIGVKIFELAKERKLRNDKYRQESEQDLLAQRTVRRKSTVLVLA
jgi:hypothetical protein